MGNRLYDVQVGALDLANDTVEHFLVIGGRRVEGTSIFKTVKPGSNRAAFAAEALAQMMQRFASPVPPETGELPGMHRLTQ